MERLNEREQRQSGIGHTEGDQHQSASCNIHPRQHGTGERNDLLRMQAEEMRNPEVTYSEGPSENRNGAAIHRWLAHKMAEICSHRHAVDGRKYKAENKADDRCETEDRRC